MSNFCEQLDKTNKSKCDLVGDEEIESPTLSTSMRCSTTELIAPVFNIYQKIVICQGIYLNRHKNLDQIK